MLTDQLRCLVIELGLVIDSLDAIEKGSVQKVLQKKEVMVRGWISKPQPRIEP
jgi:hypothetical protein